MSEIITPAVEAKYAFTNDYNEIYKTKEGTFLAFVSGKWHACTGSPWYEPDYPIRNQVIIVKQFTETENA